MHRITTAQTLERYTVRLTFESGETFDLDFTPFVERGGVFARLQDESYFPQLKIGEGGRFIEWPGGLDFCADALFEQAHSSV